MCSNITNGVLLKRMKTNFLLSGFNVLYINIYKQMNI